MLNYADILKELFPDSPLFDPAPGEGLDQFLEGWAEGEVTVYEVLKALAYIRDPYRTTVLDELEREFGLVKDAICCDEVRRAYLAAIKYSKTGNGDADFMQDRLRQAGFDVYVYENNPRSNPEKFLTEGFQMFAGDTLSQAGEPTALAGSFVGELLVNGDIYTTYVSYLTGAGDTASQAGEFVMQAGNYDGVERVPVEYEIPIEDQYWPCIFYVSGEAEFAPTDPIAPMLAGDTLSQAGEPGAEAGFFNGQIVHIHFADIPNQRRDQFRTLILRLKPLHSWAALLVNYV